MKKFSLILTFLISVFLCLALSGCNLIKYNRNYYEYSYSSTQNKFIASGFNIKFNNSGEYDLNYLDIIFHGSYESDSSINRIKTEINEDDLVAYKEMFRQMYIYKGYSENDAKNISDNLTIEDEYYVYKDYIFRASDILGAKAFESEGNIEGIYTIPSVFDTRVYFSQGKIYSEKVKYGEEFEMIPIATYDINGEIINIQKTDDNENFLFLVADFTLIYDEETGNQNQISDAIGDKDFAISEGKVSTKILLQTFFSATVFS